MPYLAIENFSTIWRHHHLQMDGISLCNTSHIGNLRCFWLVFLTFLLTYILWVTTCIQKVELGPSTDAEGILLQRKINDYRGVGQTGKNVWKFYKFTINIKIPQLSPSDCNGNGRKVIQLVRYGVDKHCSILCPLCKIKCQNIT